MKIFRTALLGTALSALMLAQAPAPTPAPEAGAPMHRNFARGRHMRGHGKAFQQLMSGYLGLSDAQKTEIQTIRTNAKASAKPIMDQLKQNRQQLKAAVEAGQPVEALATTQGQLMGKLIAIRANTRLQIHNVLTPEQQQKLQQLRSNG